MKKIVIGMSGGIDSSVAAKILKDQGYNVIGVFMRNWDSILNNDIKGNANISNICPQEKDWIDAKEVANQIKIPVQRVDFINEYWDYVFQDLIEKYKQGWTPNPDILCNKFIKFGFFYDWVFKNIKDVDYIAMGHYANVEKGYLKKAFDESKDQTYFLSQVRKEKLLKTIFPLGNILKKDVKSLALKYNLQVAYKKESTGICFIGERNFTSFLQNYIPSKPGNIISIVTKKIIGKHIGAMYYTIGQRKGLNLGGMQEPHYVVGHDLEQKIIYVAPISKPKFLISYKAKIIDVYLNYPPTINLEKSKIFVKFRYKSIAIACKIKFIDSKTLLVKYNQGFKAVTKGQEAVFYIDDYCIGSGKITKIYFHD